jgi:4-hydroxy-4-methyl-2-oxoglutarate aldolase
MEFSNQNELFSYMKQHLYTAVICDMLDDLGLRNQAMRANIRPLVGDMVLVGFAKTILSADVYYKHEHPYELEIKAVDSILPNEVIVAGTNESTQTGLWGELLTTAALIRGATGALIDGFIRDSNKIIKMDFPVFCTGFKPVDSKGRSVVIDYDCPVKVGDVLVNPGDLIFADHDGIVVIPKEHAERVVEMAKKKVQTENMTRTELLEGKLLSDVYQKYGIL